MAVGLHQQKFQSGWSLSVDTICVSIRLRWWNTSKQWCCFLVVFQTSFPWSKTYCENCCFAYPNLCAGFNIALLPNITQLTKSIRSRFPDTCRNSLPQNSRSKNLRLTWSLRDKWSHWLAVPVSPPQKFQRHPPQCTVAAMCSLRCVLTLILRPAWFKQQNTLLILECWPKLNKYVLFSKDESAILIP